MTLSVYGKFEREIVSFRRPLASGCCGCRCGENLLEVQAPAGNIIGLIKQKCSCWRLCCCSPGFYVTDASGGRRLFDINSPCCYCKCCSSVDYEVGLQVRL